MKVVAQIIQSPPWSTFSIEADKLLSSFSGPQMPVPMIRTFLLPWACCKTLIDAWPQEASEKVQIDMLL